MLSVNGAVRQKVIGRRQTQYKKLLLSSQEQSRKRKKHRKWYPLNVSEYGHNLHLSLYHGSNHASSTKSLQMHCMLFLIVLLFLCSICSGDYRYVVDGMRDYRAKLIQRYEKIESCVHQCVNEYVYCKNKVCTDIKCRKQKVCQLSYTACVKSDCVGGR